jgi:DNA (cytosine-5)-methyltransferase 1
MSYIPTANGYFSGIGGMEIGLMLSGVNVLQSLDLDPDAIECMEMNRSQYFGHSINQTDIRNEMVSSHSSSDVIVGTYPCTKYSTIADIHGTRTGDDLYLHFFRFLALKLPEMYILENVPGMRKFHVVMEAMTKLPGYYVNMFCPVETTNWLPQKRDRLILIGTKKPFSISPPSKATRIPKISDLLEKDPIYEMPEYVVSRINGKYRDRPIVVDPDLVNALAPTCVAHYSKDLGTRLVKDSKAKHGLRPFSIREYARLQGFPDDFKLPEKRSSYKLIGNAVPVPMGQWAGEQAMKYFNQKQA